MKIARSKDSQSKTALPLVALFVGLCIAVAGGLWSKRQVDYKEEAALSLAVQRVSDSIMHRFFQANYGLAGTIGLYAARGLVQFNSSFKLLI